MGDVIALPTVYKGTRFESRLEARWAVFFDEKNVRWSYEKQGFKVSGECYLPDFDLSEHFGQTVLFEVKGKHPGEEKMRFYESMSKIMKLSIIVAVGDIPLPESNFYYRPGYYLRRFERGHYVPSIFLECHRCGHLHVAEVGSEAKRGRICSNCAETIGIDFVMDYPWVAPSKALQTARVKKF